MINIRNERYDLKSYTYQAPVVKSSTAQIPIVDSENFKIGYVERYYKTVFHRIFDMWVGENKFFTNFRAFNSAGEKVVEAVKKNYTTKRSEYQFSVLHSPNKYLTLIAIQVGIDIINPVYKVSGSNITLAFKKEKLEWVKFYENNQEVGRWKISLKEKFRAHLVIEEAVTIQDPLFYAIAGQMLYFVGD